ncbi:MAG: protein O-mannosyl-transferase family, partial [Vicinamibacterales bacterium]
MASRAVVAGCLVFTLAFAAYARTLLPGVDLGDTGGFQAAVLWPETSARQAYPLYYALAKPFVAALAPDQPARGLNLFSAVCAAVASAVLTGVVTLVTGSAAGGVVAGLLLSFSYTFWTQAVIAEVYPLHLALVGACLAALAAWWRHPSTPRLALFFAVYALGFGNHLSMILLLPAFGVFVLMTAAQPSDVLRPRIVLLAIATALAGATQYVPQLLAIWTAIDRPERWSERLAAFWFDVTKSDWRESMVLGLGASQFRDRLAMVAFDARQQFGAAGMALAVAGIVSLWRRTRVWATLVLLAYAVNTAFAFTYNVGDPHVFFLPGHLFVALAAGAAVGGVTRALEGRRAVAAIVAAVAIVYAAWRGYDTWPAADRHLDRRAEQLVARMTAGLDERRDLLAADLNWQVENALLYETRYRLRHVVWTRLADVLLHFPLLVRDNHAGARDVVLTAGAVRPVATAFGSLLPIVPDPIAPPAPSLASFAARIPRGAPYVLTVLAPTRDDALDAGELSGG